MRYLNVLVIVLFLVINSAAQHLPPKEAYPYTIRQIHSGHSLTDPLFYPHWPGQFVNLVSHVRGTYAGNDVVGSTIPGSPMRWRWSNPTSYPDARQDISEFELLSITEVANLCYEGGSSEPWYQDCIQEQKDYLSLFVNNAWQNGNNGNGAASLLWSNWVNIDDSDGPFRQMLDNLGGEWERMQDYANDNRLTGAPHVYMIPGHKMMARLYDDIQAGIVPGITSINQFFSDNIHTNELGAYAIALIHYACIFNKTPIGLPHNLIENPPPGTPLPTPALANYLQNMIWDVVTSYPRTGVYSQSIIPIVETSPTTGMAPLMVTFDATRTLPLELNDLSFEWNFGDNTDTTLGRIVQHQFTQPGEYTTTLTIKADDGNSANYQVAIDVLDTQNQGDTCRYLAYEPFDYENNIPIHNLNGGQGFASNWEVQDQDVQVPGYNTQAPLSINPNLQSSGLALSGGSNFKSAGRALDTSADGNFGDYIASDTDYIGSSAEGKDLWMSVLMQKNMDDGQEMSVSIHSSNVAWCDLCENNNRISIGYFGERSQSQDVNYWSVLYNDEVFLSDAIIQIGEPHLIIGQLIFENDRTILNLYVQSNLGSFPSEPSLTIDNLPPTLIRSFAFYAGANPNASTIDEVRFAESLGCVAPADDVVFLEPPVCILSSDVTIGEVPLTVRFDGSNSYDPSGDSLRYVWDFGDGSIPQEGPDIVSHTYTTGGGIVSPRLTVYNTNGLSATSSIQIGLMDQGEFFPCLTTITSLSKANCEGEGSHIRINTSNNVEYTLSFEGIDIDVSNDHHYYNLSPGVYSLVTNGDNGCREHYDIYIEIDSTTCPGWTSSSCGMLLGTNINGVADWQNHRMFRNYLKNTRSQPIPYVESTGQWSFDDPDQVLSQMSFDPNGYPLGIPQATSEGPTRLRYFTSSEGQNMAPNQSYVLTYEGAGQITLHGTITEELESPGRISFELGGDGTFWFQIEESNPSNHIRNITIVESNDEGQDIVTFPFYNTFLEKLEPFQVLRVMDLMHTNNSTITTWDDRRRLGYYTYGGQSGVPPEIIIQLINQTQKDLWICIPHAADETYIRNLALMCKENLVHQPTIYLEYSNEVWNWIFEQSQYNIDNNPIGLMYGRAYAQKAKKVFEIWHEVFGEEACRVKRVLGIQAGFNYLNENILAHLDQNAWDYGSPTHYFGLDHEETGMPRIDILGTAATVDDIMTNAKNNFARFTPFLKEDFRNIQILGKKIITYEGGQHFVGNVFGIPYDYQQAMWDAQNTEQMYQMYQMVLDSIKAWGCVLAVNYSLTGPQESIFGSWGVLDDIEVQGPYRSSAPKYQVHIDNRPSDECIQSLRRDLMPCISTTNVQNHLIHQSSSTIRVFPNPGSHILQVAGHDTNSPIVLYNIFGQEVIRSSEPIIDTGHLPKGLYIVASNKNSTKWIKI